VLFNTTLVLIITFYFLSDGGGLIHGGLNVVPAKYREQVWFFIVSLDKVLGGYIRGQIFLSALSGLLAGGGAAVLGVPYPLLIGIVTFLLQSIPVIGPSSRSSHRLLYRSFMPVTTTVVFVLYFVAFQQLVTNVVAPRINSKAVGIHPLEAILAVLVGFPIGGILGAFLAVPIAGVIHIVVRELYGYFAHGKSMPTAVVPMTEPEAEKPAPRGSIPIEPDIIGHNVRNKHASSEG
jgi:predicted PurR-regulated permease PerM